MIHAPFAWEAFKPPHGNGLVESDVPNPAGLLHTVDAFEKLHNPVFFSRNFKARWLFHIGCLVLQQDSMQEGSFNVKLM